MSIVHVTAQLDACVSFMICSGLPSFITPSGDINAQTRTSSEKEELQYGLPMYGVHTPYM